jgi:hypothetical protein
MRHQVDNAMLGRENAVKFYRTSALEYVSATPSACSPMTAKIKTRALLVTVVTCIAVAMGYWAFSPSARFSRALAREVENGANASISIRSLPAPPWQTFYVFGPYTPASEVDRVLGFEWQSGSKQSLELGEGFNLLVLVNNQRVVISAEYPRNKGDFSTQALFRPFTSETAIFRVERTSDGRAMLSSTK